MVMANVALNVRRGMRRRGGSAVSGFCCQRLRGVGLPVVVQGWLGAWGARVSVEENQIFTLAGWE